MDLLSWFGRGGRLVPGNRRQTANEELAEHFRQCATLELLHELAARDLRKGGRVDLTHDWAHLSVKTTLRQGDFAAAAGVLVKRLCLRHFGEAMFEFVLTDNGAAALECLRAGDRIGLEAIVGPVSELDPARRASASPETTDAQRALATDLAREFAAGFESASQGTRITWQAEAAR